MSEVEKSAKRKSRGEWVALMSAYEAGDQSQREFCKAQGVPYSSFCYWRKKLCLTSGANAPELVELSGFSEQLTGDASAAGRALWRVELDLGSGAVLRIR